MTDRSRAAIRIGVGGWTYAPWRGSFYPDGLARKRELEYASRKLTSLEINATYYGAQKPDSYAKWRDETPDGFVFALKGPRYATDRAVLADAGEAIDRFFERGVMRLEEKLGPINWQFSPAKQFDPVDFRAFLTLLPRNIDGRPIRHAVEVRHKSFARREFVALAREHGVAIVLAGDSKHPRIADLTAPFVYARIMGTSEAEENGYSDADLEGWADKARRWASGNASEEDRIDTESPPEQGPREVFLYVIGGAKARNPAAAMALIERL